MAESSRPSLTAKWVGRLRRLGEGARLPVSTGGSLVLNFAGAALAFYLAWYALFAPVDSHLMATVIFATGVPVLFLTTSASVSITKRSKVDWFLAILSAGVGLYYIWNQDFYAKVMVGLTPINDVEQGMAVVTIALSFEACRRCVGLGLTSVLLVILLYTAFGQYLGAPLYHDPVGLEYFALMQTVTTYGVFGVPIEVVGTYVYLFVLFGTLYQRAGGGRLFFDVASALTGRSIGGASKACVISSGLYGSISGSPVADVVTTGPITIPLMRKTGVSAVRAGGTEAAASSGGAILPPIMGAVAFLMVEYTSVPYQEIVVSSIFCALLYYFGVLLYVHLDARRFDEGQIDRSEVRPLRQALRENWPAIIPIAVVVGLLVRGFTVPYVAAGATVSVVVASWFSRFRECRIGPVSFFITCGDTLVKIAPMVAAVLGAGIITGSIELTGLTGKFSLLLSAVAGDSVILALLVAACILILFGMGMPTTGVYILGAALIAPVLISKFGLGTFEAHLFILFYSCMSAITPPVAVACFATAPIAGANPMKIAVQACRVGIMGFVIPMFFVFHSGVLLRQSDLAVVLVDSILAVIVTVAMVHAIQGTAFGRALPMGVRLATVAVVGLIVWLDTLGAAVVAGCFAVTAVAAGMWMKRSKVLGQVE